MLETASTPSLGDAACKRRRVGSGEEHDDPREVDGNWHGVVVQSDESRVTVPTGRSPAHVALTKGHDTVEANPPGASDRLPGAVQPLGERLVKRPSGSVSDFHAVPDQARRQEDNERGCAKRRRLRGKQKVETIGGYGSCLGSGVRPAPLGTKRPPTRSKEEDRFERLRQRVCAKERTRRLEPSEPNG